MSDPDPEPGREHGLDPFREPGVDFVDDDGGSGDDEELAHHGSTARRRPSGRPGPWQPTAWRDRAEAFLRGRFGLPMVVVALVLAYLVGRALLHERPTGAPPASTSSSSSAARASAAALDLPRRTGPDPTDCPGLRCYTSSSVPAEVRAAVRATFPAARFTATETIRLVDRAHGDPLWYREVVAQVGTATLTLRVQAHAAGDTPDGDARDDGSRSVTFLDARLQQWFVRAQVVDRSGTQDVLDRLGTLMADPRLVTS